MPEQTAAASPPEGSLTDPSLLGQPRQPRRRVRRIATWVLVVLFAVLLPLTLTSAWAVRTVTNTQRYVDTLQPLAQDPVVTNFVADRATTLLFEQLDVQKRVEHLLPAVASPLAAPLTNQLEHYVDVEMRQVVASKWFADFWRRENTYTHSTALDLLTGKTPPPASEARSLVVSLTPALVQAIDKLDAKGVTVFNPIRTELEQNRSLTLKLFSNKQVKMVSGYLNLAITLRWVLWIVTIVAGVGAVLCSLQRRRGATRVLGGGILGLLVLLGGLTVGRSLFISAANPDAQQFATHLWDIMLRFLRQLVISTLVVLVVADLVLWLTGPSTWAVAVRRTARTGSRKLAEKTEEAYHSERTAKAVASARGFVERAAAFSRSNLKALRWAGVVVAGIFLFFTSTTSGIWWIVVLLAIYEVAVSIPTWRGRTASTGAAAEEEPTASAGAPKD
jgi:hypothetical protein